MLQPQPIFSFDTEINRRAVPALKTHKKVLGEDCGNLFAAGVADMDFQAPPAVLAALQNRLDHGVFGYEAVPDELMPAVTGWLENRHGWQVDANHVLRAPNVLNILAIAASLFTSPDDGIIIQPPVFFDFCDILRENNRQLIPNPLILDDGHYSMDYEGLERLVAEPSTKMLFLCNPHNPVGRVWTRAELQKLADICLRHDVLVVSDEIHGDITFPGHAYTPYASLGSAAAANSITCLSPAKSFNIASCCSAFTVISNDIHRNAFETENSRLTVNKNNAFSSSAMIAAYSESEPWLDSVLNYLTGNLQLVREQLKKISSVQLIEPEGTFLLWLDLRGLGFNPDDLIVFLKTKAFWAITCGQSFGVEGEGFARLNIACPRSHLAAALKQLLSAVTQHSKTDKLGVTQ